jgi:hypothetical protein
LFDLSGHTWKTLNTSSTCVINSVPVSVCDNIRIPWPKIYTEEEYRGYQASKKRYFYGLKIHLMVISDGQPIECFLTQDVFEDVEILEYDVYKPPEYSINYADKAYNDYEIEDLLKEGDHIN